MSRRGSQNKLTSGQHQSLYPSTLVHFLHLSVIVFLRMFGLLSVSLPVYLASVEVSAYLRQAVKVTENLIKGVILRI